MKRAFLFAAAAIIAPAAWADLASFATPPLPGASVTIPYSELQSLWSAARPRTAPSEPAQPPLPYLIHEVEAQLVIGEQTSALDLKFQVESFSAEWCTIPLVSGAARLEKPRWATPAR